jgi:SAM-dependent methyltransferase
LQKILKLSDTESEFWGDYLGKFGIIEQAHYYAEYFHSVASSLGAIEANDVIVDAGCGNGFYGISLLKTIQLQAKTRELAPGPFHYCGIDLTSDGLMRSYLRQVDARISEEMAELSRSLNVAFSYRKMDFDILDKGEVQLPFADGSVSKICCSLVLSYLKTPINLMKEFYRILKPGGVAVVSSMKPGCDMTVLFHEYVEKDLPDREHGDDANRLLSAAGKIKLKRDSGVYQFFDEEELMELSVGADFKQMSVSRSLGDQANVIRLAK